MKGLVYSWFFPPINSSEGLVTFKLLKNSEYNYDVFTQKNDTVWTYGANENKLVSKNINPIFAQSDNGRDWVKEGVEYYEKNKNKYDFIMTRSMSPDAHKIALEIKKRHPEVKWIASFGDPISDNPFEYFNRVNNPYAIKGNRFENLKIGYIISPMRLMKSAFWKLRRKRYLMTIENESKKFKLQTSVLNQADRIILNNPYQKEHMLKKQKNRDVIEKKIIIIPHTYDKEFYAKKVHKNNEKIVISYLGHCDDERTPKCFFEALGRLKSKYDNISDKLIVNFYGDLSVKDKARIIDEEIYDFVKVRKPVTYFESLKIMQESDWLLLIDANLGQYINENIFFAAKIADYLGANNNILGITMEKGASADILRETNSIVSSHSSDEIYMYLSQIINNRCLHKTCNQEKYNIKNVVGDYDKMVEELVRK